MLASAALIAIGVTASLAALGSTAKIEAKEENSEFLTRLVHEKYNEVVATEDLTQSNFSGDFTDRTLPDYTWTATTQPTPTTNLFELTVTIQNTSDSNQQTTEEGLVFVPPATTGTQQGGGQ